MARFACGTFVTVPFHPLLAGALPRPVLGQVRPPSSPLDPGDITADGSGRTVGVAVPPQVKGVPVDRNPIDPADAPNDGDE